MIDNKGVVNDGGTEVLQQASGNTAADSVVDGAEVLDNASVTELNDQESKMMLQLSLLYLLLNNCTYWLKILVTQ